MSALAWQSRAALLLVGTAIVAWVVTVERMRGMDAGPGTDLGGLGWYLGIWVTMMAAMMLPSAAPFAARLASAFPALVFAAGYLAVWTGFGLAAYGLFRVVKALDPAWIAWDQRGPYLAGGVLVAAGVYEATSLKERFLRRCRAPADASGLAYGLDCVGCCVGLMAALFALGVMSLLWMVAIAGVIFAEKVFPQGIRFSRVVALALVVFGIWVAASPGSVPGLTEPDQMPSMRMEM
jgi:predicted metal-binding membrane protein